MLERFRHRTHRTVQSPRNKTKRKSFPLLSLLCWKNVGVKTYKEIYCGLSDKICSQALQNLRATFSNKKGAVEGWRENGKYSTPIGGFSFHLIEVFARKTGFKKLCGSGDFFIEQ